MKAYAGIGSRNTPNSVCLRIVKYARRLYRANYLLRSGGAGGADFAFESGHDMEAQVSGRGKCKKEIYLPCEGYGGHQSSRWPPSARAWEIAAATHPRWKKLVNDHRLLHARNSHQVLGQDCQSPVDFIVCWTDPFHSGGTDQALRIAEEYMITVYNLNSNDDATLLELRLIGLGV
jgi:hypothetical protein